LDPIEARSLFPVTDKVIYLQHGGASLSSTRIRDAVDRVGRIAAENHDWGAEYTADIDGLRTSLASMIRVDPDEITFTRGTAQGVSLLRGLDWRDGDNVVSVRGEYPANVFPWTTLWHLGVELRLIDPPDGRATPERLMEVVDERTRVLSLSWIEFWNGYRADIARIGEECRRREIIFAVDAIQGVGVIPLDTRAANIDLLACGASKWLLGPGGIGFCYVSKELLDRIVPPIVGVGSMVLQQGDAFEELTEFVPNARRFEESQVSWFDIAAFKAGVEIINEVGIDVIEPRVLGLSSMIGSALADRGFRMVEPWPRSREESSGMVSVRPGTPADQTVELLKEAGIIARLYRDLVRFSCAFFNTEEELETVIDFMDTKIER
jgi:cysteine desulfurase/selenocysteine lyase